MKQALTFAIILLGMAILSACNTSESAEDTGRFTHFTQIPGVTQEHITAINALKETHPYFVYAMLQNDETFIDAHGNPAGFTYYVTNWFTQLFGVPFVPTIMNRDEILTGLDNGDVHFTGGLMRTPERTPYLNMTDPIGHRAVVTLRLPGALPLETIAETRPLRLAFPEMRILSDVFYAMGIFEDAHVEYVCVCLGDDVEYLLRTGQIDAYFGDGLHTLSIQFPNLEIAPFYPFMFLSTSFSAKDPALASIVEVMQLLIENGGMPMFGTLYAQGLADLQAHRMDAMLTQAGRDFIANNPVIYYGTECSGYPVTFYNRFEGAHQGIAIDVLEGIAALTGLEFKRIPCEELLHGAVVGAVDTGQLTLGLGAFRPEYFAQYPSIMWSDSFFSNHYALLSHKDLGSVNINEVIYHRVGIINDSLYYHRFTQWFPQHSHLIFYPDQEQLLRALVNQEVDMAFASTGALLRLANFYQETGFWANIEFNQSFHIHFGVHQKDGALIDILNNALKIIDTEGIARDWTSRSFDYNILLMRSRQLQFIIAILALTVILGLLMILIGRILSERQRLKNTVDARTQELHLASQYKSAFIANMSHEIRTPMNSIVGFAELARFEDMSEQASQYIQHIQNSSQWLLQIINDILDISKIESGKLELEEAPFVLADIITSLESVMLPLATENNNRLKLQGDPLDCQLLGDELRLKQIFMNLLSNANKFTKDGTVALTYEIEVHSHQEKTLHFKVKDTGIGMTEEQITRAFEPFMQADTSITRKFGGTGLGLTIVQNFLEAMGSKLTVTSQVGLGTTFKFSIKFKAIRVDATPPPPPPKKRPVKQPFFAGTVLICEDNEMNQIVITDNLHKLGVHAVVAKNGQDAIAQLQGRMAKGLAPFDLIFMDIHMPIMGGVEATKKIIALGVKTPIIAMTANVITNELDKYLSLGMQGYIGKPFTTEALWNCLAQHLTKIEKEDGKMELPNFEKMKPPTQDPELMPALQGMFLRGNVTKYQELMDSLNTKDIKTAHRIVHSLKSSAFLIEEGDLAHVCRVVEFLLKDGENHATQALLEELEHELNLVLRKLEVTVV